MYECLFVVHLVQSDVVDDVDEIAIECDFDSKDNYNVYVCLTLNHLYNKRHLVQIQDKIYPNLTY